MISPRPHGGQLKEASAMTVRKASLSDIPSLVDMRILYLNEDNGQLDTETEKQIRKQLPGYFTAKLGKELYAFIAEDNGCTVGCCLLLVTEKPANPRFPHGMTGTVLNVYTCPEYRRQGIAGGLMGLLIAQAKELRLDLIELKATADGAKLYKSLGFEQDFSRYTDMKMVF